MGNTVQATKPGDKGKSLSHDPAKLRWRRFAAGMTATALASAAGCSKANISMLEKGKHGASPETLKSLASVLGCEITDLMPDEPKGAAA